MRVKIAAVHTALFMLASASTGSGSDDAQEIMSLLLLPDQILLLPPGNSSHTTLPAGSQPSDVPKIPAVTPSPPTTPSPKLVFAHHIVGNTYNYTLGTWNAGTIPRHRYSNYNR